VTPPQSLAIKLGSRARSSRRVRTP